MKVVIGKKVKQKDGYESFAPAGFPPQGIFDLPAAILIKTAEADRLVGKLDGITHTLPDVDFFCQCLLLRMPRLPLKLRGQKRP